jgi:type II secretory pathway pseudopilin PulG
MTSKLRSTRGSALVPAMLVMMMMAMSGAAVLATVDTQQRESRRERARESTFQLVEGVLNTQIYRLSKRWPDSTGNMPHPVACPTVPATVDCPDTAALKQTFDNVDQGTWSSVNWATQVRDDDDPATPPVDVDGDPATPAVAVDDYYSDGLLNVGARYDRNGNDKLWVRAEATVRGRRRVVVALVKAEVIPSKVVPNESIVAGWFTTETNSASKEFVLQGADGDIYVRCGSGGTAPLPPDVNDDCAEYQMSKNGTTTVSPPRVYSNPNYGNAFEDPEYAVDGFRERAITLGNYYASGCPSLQGQHPGELVFIENLGSGCKYEGNDVYNTASKPGSVVIARGGPLELTGTVKFYGLLYHANLQETVDGLAMPKTALLKVHGTAQVVGGLYVDGFQGGVSVGTSGRENLIHNSNAGASLQSFGTAGIVQNSFRELRGGTTGAAL